MSHRSVLRANVTKVAFIRSPATVAGGRPDDLYGVVGESVTPGIAAPAVWELLHFDFCSLMISVALGKGVRGIEDEEIK